MEKTVEISSEEILDILGIFALNLKVSRQEAVEDSLQRIVTISSKHSEESVVLHYMGLAMSIRMDGILHPEKDLALEFRRYGESLLKKTGHLDVNYDDVLQEALEKAESIVNSVIRID